MHEVRTSLQGDWDPSVPECVVPRHQVGEGEDGGVGRDLLLPQGTFNLLPVPHHYLIIIGALCKEEEGRGTQKRRGAEGKWEVKYLIEERKWENILGTRPLSLAGVKHVCVLSMCVSHVGHSRLPSMTVEVVGKEISWNFGETTATGGLFTRGSVRWKTRN